MVRQEERPWHGESLVLLDTRALAFPTAPGERRNRPPSNGRSRPRPASPATWPSAAGGSTVVTGGGQVAHDELDRRSSTCWPTSSRRCAADLQPLATALTGLGRDASVFAVLGRAPPSARSPNCSAGPGCPASAVALLLRPWTWNVRHARTCCAEAAWQSDRRVAAGGRLAGGAGRGRRRPRRAVAEAAVEVRAVAPMSDRRRPHDPPPDPTRCSAAATGTVAGGMLLTTLPLRSIFTDWTWLLVSIGCALPYLARGRRCCGYARRRQLVAQPARAAGLGADGAVGVRAAAPAGSGVLPTPRSLHRHRRPGPSRRTPDHAGRARPAALDRPAAAAGGRGAGRRWSP